MPNNPATTQRFDGVRFGADVRRMREAIGATVRELEELTGVSSSTICKIEHAMGVPLASSFLALCYVLALNPRMYYVADAGAPKTRG